jgi:hypothetical protein
LNKLCILFIGSLFFSCQTATPIEETQLPQEVVKVIEERLDFDWLLGNWERLNEEDGKQTFDLQNFRQRH